MTIDCIDSLFIGNADVVWLDSNKFAKSLVLFVNDLVAIASAANSHEPEVGESSIGRCRDVTDSRIGDEVWVEERQDNSTPQSRHCPDRP